MEKENLCILRVLTKDNSKIFTNKVWEYKNSQMVMFSKESIKMESQMVKENISGKMVLIMKATFYKVCETDWANGTKIRTVFMKVNLNKTINMVKESNTTKTEAISKDSL